MKTVFKAIFCAFLAFVIAIAIISVIEVGKINNDGNITVPPWASTFPFVKAGVTTTYKGENVWHVEGTSTDTASCLIKKVTIRAPQTIKIETSGLEEEAGKLRYIDIYKENEILEQIKENKTSYIKIEEAAEYLIYISMPMGQTYNNDIYIKAKVMYPKKFNYFEKAFNYIGSLSNIENYWEYMREPLEDVTNAFLALQGGVNWSNVLNAIGQSIRMLILPIELSMRTIMWVVKLLFYTLSIIWV